MGHRTILNVFMFIIILEQTLLRAITQIQRATKMSPVFLKNFNMKIKHVFSAFVARYASMQNVLEKNFSAKVKDI